MSGAARSSRSAMQIVNSSDDDTDNESPDLDQITVAAVTQLEPLQHVRPLPDVSLGAPIADFKQLVDTCDQSISYYTTVMREDLTGRKRLWEQVDGDIERLRAKEELLQSEIDQTRDTRRRREVLKGKCTDAINRCKDQWDGGLDKLQTPAVRHARTILTIYENQNCPITGESMLEDGVVANDGNMYHRLALNQALTIKPDTSPLTNAPMVGTLNEARVMCSAIRALNGKSS